MANRYIANTRITIRSINETIERGDEFPANLPDVDYDGLLKKKFIVYGKSLRNANSKRDSKRVQVETFDGDANENSIVSG